MEELISMIPFMGPILDAIGPYIVPLMTIVTASTAFTAVTPTTVDNKIVNVILKVLNVAAGNVAKNKNADDK